MILDAGPINSLWVAGELDLIKTIGLPVVIVDEVYFELTSDLSYPKDRDVKLFLDNAPFLTIEQTDTGRHALKDRSNGIKVKPNRGEIAIHDFLIDSEDGLGKYTKDPTDSVLLLFEDADVNNVVIKLDNVHRLSTVAMLRGLESIHKIKSADAIISAMTHPKNTAGRKFTDLPNGIDEESRIKSAWKPK
jgi:hypothetical protein